jgi:hypothetical protein
MQNCGCATRAIASLRSCISKLMAICRLPVTRGHAIADTAEQVVRAVLDGGAEFTIHPPTSGMRVSTTRFEKPPSKPKIAPGRDRPASVSLPTLSSAGDATRIRAVHPSCRKPVATLHTHRGSLPGNAFHIANRTLPAAEFASERSTPKPASERSTPKPASEKSTPKSAREKSTPKPAREKTTPKPAGEKTMVKKWAEAKANVYAKRKPIAVPVAIIGV